MRIGVDLGGTKIEALAIDDAGNELLRRRVDTPVGDYKATIAAVGGLVHWLEGELAQKASVGVGIPGAISVTGLVKNANSVCLIGKTIDRDLENLLGRQVRIANDADCFALSEASDGGGAGFPIVFGVILGTGVGGGITVNGRLLSGANAIAGEWGHNPLPWPESDEIPGYDCYCGRSGCIETFLSGPAFARIDGRGMKSQEILALADVGDAHSKNSMRRYEERLAKSLAHVINILDPHAIVLGGGMSNIKRLYQNVPKLWGKWIFSDRVNTKMVPPKHGDASGVRGAAWLWDLASPPFSKGG